jgi:Mg2+ and Co2+ transporter CorA
VYDPDHCPKASWFHVLCKDIEVDRDNSHIIDEHLANQENPLSQSSFSWLRSAYFMRWTRNPHKSVTLICFEHPPFLRDRLREHLPNMWEQVVNNPFDLWVVVLHELFKQIDNQAWNLGNVFRGIERDLLSSAQQIKADRETGARDSDFVGLHLVAKHCIYLKEALAAIDRTQEDLSLQHKEYFEPPSSMNDWYHFRATQNMLKHKRGLFRSTGLRIESLDRRVDNIINLAFNLVVLKDSRVMVKDSLRMETIATVTLFFLPVATVGTMFGSQFFGLDISKDPPRLRVSKDYWIFWVVLVGIASLVLSMACIVRGFRVGKWTRLQQKVRRMTDIEGVNR